MPRPLNFSIIFVLASLIAASSSRAEPIRTTFSSPRGLTEECVRLEPLPGATYSDDDLEEEALFCSIDFYAPTGVALCPKTWSTSPGTMIYDIKESGLSPAQYEAQSSCGKKGGHSTIAKFKQSMNQEDTSATYSPSSLVYYHLSRYFDADLSVPPAVFRSMDKDAHYDRVTEKAYTRNMGVHPMNKAGWKWLYRGEQNPAGYGSKSELFLSDLRQIYGILIDGGGEGYGTEINGPHAAWGDQQSYAFQKTPAFLALSSTLPLQKAMAWGVSEGLKNPEVRKDMGPSPSEFQMFIWMKEISELVLLDFILSQQDRSDNIDYKWYIYWRQADGSYKSKRIKTDIPRKQMNQIDYPKEVDGAPTVLVQRTQINDNDAGVKAGYTNFTKRTGMLEKLRHFDAKTYQKLLQLNADLTSQGPVYASLKSNFKLTERDLKKLIENTNAAAAILQKTCDTGQLTFDLKSPKFYLKGDITPVSTNCR